jgi:acetyl-CoA carboxylase carboxyltransferase component
VVVADEAEASVVARRYLGYFQGSVPRWEAPDPTLLRSVVPQDRARAYDVRSAVHGLCDLGSVLELRPDFGPAAVTALARIEGRPIGVVASQPLSGGGAIDAPAADKMARFEQLCDAFALPLVALCDTPGFLVGPHAEKQAGVRHYARLFVLGANLTVPVVTVVLRKAYGLGAMSMAAGGFHETAATLAWPTAEFGAMGLEGAVRLGARDRLAAIADPRERQEALDALVAKAYDRGGAINTARHLEIDDVIDPADTRPAVAAALQGAPTPVRDGWVNPRRRSGIDPW